MSFPRIASATAAVLTAAALTMSGCGQVASTPADSSPAASSPTSSPADSTPAASSPAASPTSTESVTSGSASPSASPIVLPSPSGAASSTAAGQAAWEALFSADGEYAAFATYQAVIDKFGPVEPFANIAASEQNHIDALKRQLVRLGVTVPDNPYLGKIGAPATLKEAATAGVLGEQHNIAMYDRLMNGAAGDAVLTEVLVSLRDASQKHHLPAFERAAR